VFQFTEFFGILRLPVKVFDRFPKKHRAADENVSLAQEEDEKILISW